MEEYAKDINSCLSVLRSGGIILYPTDTVWGIGCDATNAEAVARIYRLKNRSDEKSMIVLVAEEKDVLRYVAAPDLAVFDYLKQVTKPTTVVYDGALLLANNLVARDGSVAIRICHDPFCKQLIKRLGKPIVSTSANLSASPTPKIFDEISTEVREGVDYVVHYRRSDRQIAEPSSVVRWNKDGSLTIIRP